MPREPSQYTTELAQWAQKQRPVVSISKIKKDTGLAYRTCHLAFHGYKVSYETACVLSKYTNGEVSVEDLCSKPRRAEYKSLVGK